MYKQQRTGQIRENILKTSEKSAELPLHVEC